MLHRPFFVILQLSPTTPSPILPNPSTYSFIFQSTSCFLVLDHCYFYYPHCSVSVPSCEIGSPVRAGIFDHWFTQAPGTMAVTEQIVDKDLLLMAPCGKLKLNMSYVLITGHCSNISPSTSHLLHTFVPIRLHVFSPLIQHPVLSSLPYPIMPF